MVDSILQIGLEICHCFVFRNNRLTAEGAVVIGKGLSLNESLQVLKVSYMPIYIQTF